ncbi:MAG TPA: carbohydrate ABC transporter permease [Clostridia bacterium]|nr:carbohydrate ABC transporter permease [Clostridia bacterium]
MAKATGGGYLRRLMQRASLHGVLILLCIIWIYPIVWMVSASFKTNAQMWNNSAGLIPDPLQLDNYVRAWTTSNFSIYFLNTVIFAVSVVALIVFLGSTSGYVLGRFKFPGKRLIMVLFIGTTVVPRATTIIPLFQLADMLGLLNNRIGYTLAYTSKTLIIAILLFIGFYIGVPREMEDSGAIDGCNFWQQFRHIMLPLAKPIIGTVTILNTIGAWKAFMIPLVFTFSRPNLRTLGVGMYAFVGEFSSDWAAMAAAASISIVPMMVVFLLFQRYFIEGLAGAVKG